MLPLSELACKWFVWCSWWVWCKHTCSYTHYWHTQTTSELPMCLSSPHLLIHFLRLASTPWPSPPVFETWGRQAVRGVDNLLLTLSCNKDCSCCHGDSGGQRETRVSVLSTDREGTGGTGWADRLHLPPPSYWHLKALPAWQLVELLLALMVGFAVCKHRRAAIEEIVYYH